MELTDRKQKVLSSVVRSFIQTGEPIGSKSIADEIGVSSATIRNEMSELINLGLLEQPHTSAGRVPSHIGYRQYLNGLSAIAPISEEERNYFESILIGDAYDSRRLLKAMSRLVAAYSKYSSVIIPQTNENDTVKAIQFVQIGRRTAMLIVMTSSGMVRNRIFHCDFDLTTDIVRMLFRLFNEKITGVLVSDINVAYIQSMSVAMGEFSILSASALMALLEIAKENVHLEVLVSGQMNLISHPDFEARDLKELMSFLEDRAAIVRLFGKTGKRTEVFIGNETGARSLNDASVITSRFQTGGGNSGIMGIIGPVRMDYEKLLSALDFLSERLGQMLVQLIEDE